MLSPILRSETVIKLNQKSALKRIDAIEKGKIKALAPKHTTTAKLQRDIDKDNKIKEVLNSKEDSFIDRINKININSSDPPVTANRHGIRKEQYGQQNFSEHEYGFFELPLEKMKNNKVMFREAIEILRARMELLSNKSPHDQSFFEQQSDYIQNHPAVKRVDKDKLERVWQYFRPFAIIRDQMLLSKTDLQEIDRYIEGADMTMTPYRLELRKRIRQLESSSVAPARPGDTKQQQEEFEKILRDRHEKEMQRLQKRMEELKELEEETRKRTKA
ncbi:hypothetical protein niasHT_010082 [Heterodera trifolii]|uniref:Uncharacterized protein n=1 Tax=Heterodera trifolii TaxID=157864 RepID=A0ABD2LX28_9BILA